MVVATLESLDFVVLASSPPPSFVALAFSLASVLGFVVVVTILGAVIVALLDVVVVVVVVFALCVAALSICPEGCCGCPRTSFAGDSPLGGFVAVPVCG